MLAQQSQEVNNFKLNSGIFSRKFAETGDRSDKGTALLSTSVDNNSVPLSPPFIISHDLVLKTPPKGCLIILFLQLHQLLQVFS